MSSDQPSKFPCVVFVILTWNQCKLTLECLDSVSRLNYPNYRIVVVDNGSQDSTVEEIHRIFPDVITIENRENLGYSEGNNIGIRRAFELGAEYLFLLNNDVNVDPAMLQALVDVAEADSHIGAVSPKIYYYDDPMRIWAAGACIDWRNGNVGRLQAEQYEVSNADGKPVAVNALSSCAICIKREMLEKVGLLDPSFFIYYDEMDWCVRAQRSGYALVYVPGAKIWHKVSASMKQDSPRTAYYMNRNTLLFLRKELQGRALFLVGFRQLKYQLRTIGALTFKPEYASRKTERNARVRAILDAAMGQYGRRM
jgi:GT2 family glycosyltransferase